MIGHPPRMISGMPQSAAMPKQAYAPPNTAFGDSRPACVTRIGPSRSCVSAPRLKSRASFTRFVPIWMNTAPNSAHPNAIQWIGIGPPYASAVPTSTGATAADSVLGRAARSQEFIVRRSPFAVRRAEDLGERRTANCDRSLRKSRKLLEVRLALLDVRVAPFLSLFRHVEQQRCVPCEIEKADLSVAIGVHRALDEADCHRRQRE